MVHILNVNSSTGNGRKISIKFVLSGNLTTKGVKLLPLHSVVYVHF